MDIRKTLLYVVLIFLGVTLWHTWLQEHPINSAAKASQMAATTDAQHPADFAPTTFDTSHVKYHDSAKTPSPALSANKVVTVKTDLLDAVINLNGGNLVSAKLLKYPVSLQEKNTPIQILNPDNNDLYIAQSGLSSPNTQASENIVYTAEKSDYVLSGSEKTLVVTLTGKTSQGLAVEKTFTFHDDSYVIQTAITLKNTASNDWTGGVYHQITRRYVGENGSFYSRAYSGASYSTPNTPYKKLTFSNMFESDLSRNLVGGWIAMQQHYFLSTWVPAQTENLHYYSRSFGHGDEGKNNVYVLGYVTPQFQLKPGESQTFASNFYVGPEIAKNLEPLAKGLGLTVDYGWLWPISKFLFWLMSEIHKFVGNWGWSIILVTIVIKIAFSWLSHKSYLSMAKTRELQPRIHALKERFGDDRQAMSKAMMELYRKEKINPVGGCLPMVIQIPVFIALYYVLIESVELRQAPFIFWIHDLSVKDPYYILPILMGLSMLLQQKLSPPPPDPAQAKMMMFLPVIFTVFFATFPAGLVLYWLTNNCVSVLHQWLAMKGYRPKKASKRKK